MNNSTMMDIGAVERDTGLGKDTLRVWERRYGFPQPLRDANGERLYPSAQVERLRLIKRLIDQGHRPGRLVSASADELLSLAGGNQPPPVRALADDQQRVVSQLLELLKAHDVQGLRHALNHALLRQGLQRFVLDTVEALNRSVGEAWMRGELEVFEEHVYSEQMKSLLRQAISSVPSTANGWPRILLTTVPEEHHVLGLLMVEGLLTLDGATCISLGAQTPLVDIRQAAQAHDADIVALSFSLAFPSRQIAAVLNQLRELLPASVELWAGGAGVAKIKSGAGVTVLPTLEAALTALRDARPASA